MSPGLEVDHCAGVLLGELHHVLLDELAYLKEHQLDLPCNFIINPIYVLNK